MSSLSSLLSRLVYNPPEITGHSGDAGHTKNRMSCINALPATAAVTSAASVVVTLVTDQASVTTVTNNHNALVTEVRAENTHIAQTLTEPVTTVTGVTTENDGVAQFNAETPLQTNSNACWICGAPEGDRYFIAVLSPRPGLHYWMHSACWPEHCRRESARRRGKKEL